MSIVRDVAVGGYHTCALLESGAVYCWGSNVSRQLGLETASQTIATPTEVTHARGKFRRIVAGTYHTCGLEESGRVLCWGGEGTLGAGEPGDLARASSKPVITLNGNQLTAVTSMCAGHDHTCGIRADGVWCWGVGGLGIGSNDYGGVAAPALSEANVRSVHCGLQSTVAFKGDSADRFAWGRDPLGADTGGSTPRKVPGSTLFSISMGDGRTCYTDPGSALHCGGASQDLYTGWPVVLEKVQEVATGRSQVCALTLQKAVDCLRQNDTPERRLMAAERLFTGPYSVHMCSTVLDGSLICWGSNGTGQLGRGEVSDGAIEFSPAPVRWK